LLAALQIERRGLFAADFDDVHRRALFSDRPQRDPYRIHPVAKHFSQQ